MPDIPAWATLADVVPEDSDELRLPTLTVRGPQHDVEGVPTSDLRLFGPRGLLFQREAPDPEANTQQGGAQAGHTPTVGRQSRRTETAAEVKKKVMIRVRSGHDDVRSGSKLSALHLSVPCGEVVACGLTGKLPTYVGDSDIEHVDVRWLQLLRDSGEMLLCHSFTMPGCTCLRHKMRRPDIHDSSARVLRELGVLHALSLSAVLMMYVLACAHVFAPRETRRGKKDSKLWHVCVAKAVGMAVELRSKCRARWGGHNEVCAERFMSILAALPSAILGELREPFEPETWATAMEAARTRQGSSKRLQKVCVECLFAAHVSMTFVAWRAWVWSASSGLVGVV